ncbi:MAG: DUF4258 domain-containing protein [Proteobacteria bacterium]|nr:DUF4258 domain-containing protein [Pseudomonadota bacterium]
MSDATVLDEIRRLVRRGSIVLTRHARDRLAERGASVRDLVAALLGATQASWQVDRANWRVSGGRDLDGDEMTVIVDLVADVIVVTIF